MASIRVAYYSLQIDHSTPLHESTSRAQRWELAVNHERHAHRWYRAGWTVHGAKTLNRGSWVREGGLTRGASQLRTLKSVHQRGSSRGTKRAPRTGWRLGGIGPGMDGVQTGIERQRRRDPLSGDLAGHSPEWSRGVPRAHELGKCEIRPRPRGSHRDGGIGTRSWRSREPGWFLGSASVWLVVLPSATVHPHFGARRAVGAGTADECHC